MIAKAKTESALTDLLKTETRDLHKRLERTLNLQESFQTRETYSKTLWFFYLFQLETQRQLTIYQSEIPAILNIEYRNNLPRIMADIRKSGQTIKFFEHDFHLHLKSFSEFMGFYYVVEGSTLGGQFIVQFLEKTLGTEIRACASYFDPYGDQCQTMWLQFKRTMEELYKSGKIKKIGVIEGAVKTFSYLYDLTEHHQSSHSGKSIPTCLNISNS